MYLLRMTEITSESSFESNDPIRTETWVRLRVLESENELKKKFGP